MLACDYGAVVAEDIGRSLLVYGRRIPRAEMFARLDAVTPETVTLCLLFTDWLCQ